MLALDPSVAQSDQSLMTLFDSHWESQAFRAASPAGLAAGSTAGADVKIANTVDYLHNAVFKSKSPAEAAFTDDGTHDIAASTNGVREQVYLVSLDGAGEVTLTAGGTTTGANTAPLPERVTGLTPIGYVRVAVNPAQPGDDTSFKAGSTALTDDRMTVTYVDVGHYGKKFSGNQ